jgi:hypothetical protein
VDGIVIAFPNILKAGNLPALFAPEMAASEHRFRGAVQRAL